MITFYTIRQKPLVFKGSLTVQNEIFSIIIINLSLLLAISWGYIIFRIKKTIINEKKILTKIKTLKGVIDKHNKSEPKEINDENSKLQYDCISNLKSINDNQIEIINEIDRIDKDNNLDFETKEKYIKAELGKLKSQANNYENTIKMLKENIEQSSYRLSFAEDKLLKQKEEILNLRNIKDKNEITSKRNISLNNENIKLRSIIEDKKTNTKLANELSKHKNKIEEQGSELSQLMKEYVKLEQEMKKTPKQTTDSTNDIDNNIREIEFALERALTEKDFLESQFLELLDNHDEQLQLKDELKRTKTEYLMLEEHFIDLADKV